jgi:hypothetical protein
MREIFLAFLALSNVASASVIYTYVGNPFTTVTGSGGPSTANFLTLSIAVDNPFPANWLNGSVVFHNWSMSDGVSFLSGRGDYGFNLPPPGSASLQWNVYTDSSGNITDWLFEANQGPIRLSTWNPPYTCCPGPLEQSVYSNNGPNFFPTSIATNAEMPGTWVVTISDTPVPEPAVWMIVPPYLLLIGLLRARKMSMAGKIQQFYSGSITPIYLAIIIRQPTSWRWPSQCLRYQPARRPIPSGDWTFPGGR